MAGLVGAGAKRLLEEALRSAGPAIYISLHTADPGTTGANEQSGAGYARAAVGSWTFPASAAGNLYTAANAAQIDYPDPTASYAAPITHAGYWDAAAAGTYLMGFALASPVTPQRGTGLFFPAGALELALATQD